MLTHELRLRLLGSEWIMKNCMQASEMISHICILERYLWLNWRAWNEEEPYKARITSREEISVI